MPTRSSRHSTWHRSNACSSRSTIGERGVAVLSRILAGIDTDTDDVISDVEQRARAARVLADISLSIDGTTRLRQLTAMTLSSIAELKEGLGVIAIDFDASVPNGGANRRLTFENRHQRAMEVYLVNCVMPRDSAIRITGQNRNYAQSEYRMDYSDGVWTSSASWPLRLGSPAAFTVMPMAWVAAIHQRRRKGAVGMHDA